MIQDFSGFTKGVIGKKLPSDSTLNNMKKAELIELLKIAQHNYETLNSFYNNAVKLNYQKLENGYKLCNVDDVIRKLENSATRHDRGTYYAGVNMPTFELWRIKEVIEEACL